MKASLMSLELEKEISKHVNQILFSSVDYILRVWF